MRQMRKIEAEAAAWLMRHDRCILDARQQAEFEAWLRADARHVIAFHEIQSAWSVLDRPAGGRAADSLRDQLHKLNHRDRKRWRVFAAGAAVLTAACLIGLLFLPKLHHSSPAVARPSGVTARIVEAERRELSDGSIVLLKSGAAIEEHFEERVRKVILARGAAHFSVVPNPERPFIVSAQGVTVRAVGTAFAVQLGHTDVEVLVTEGKVTIGSPPAASQSKESASPTADPLVGTRQRAVVSLVSDRLAPTIESLSEEEVSKRMSWRVPRIEFTETTLAEAVQMINKCSAVQLRLADKKVGSMRVTGFFRSDNATGFVRAVEMTLGLQSERAGQEIVLRAGN